MDEMPLYEVELYTQFSWMADKNTWEQTRMQMLVTAQANSKKRLKATDILTFPWESDKPSLPKEMTSYDIARLEAKSRKIEKELNGKN